MIKLPKDRYGNEGWVVKARRHHYCESSTYRCDRSIKPGDHYYRAIAWSRTEVNEGPAPWVMKICRGCLNEEQQAAFDALLKHDPEPTDLETGAERG